MTIIKCACTRKYFANVGAAAAATAVVKCEEKSALSLTLVVTCSIADTLQIKLANNEYAMSAAAATCTDRATSLPFLFSTVGMKWRKKTGDNLLVTNVHAFRTTSRERENKKNNMHRK